MYRIVLWATIWMASFGVSLSQTLEIEGGDVFENGNICLDVSVTGFQDVLSMDFQLRWDSTVLDFSSATADETLPGFDDSKISDPTETSPTTPKNILLVSWFDNDLVPRSLSDGQLIFQVCFDAIGPLGSSSTMNLMELEFFDGDLNPIDFEDQDGIVNISNAAGDNLSFDFPTIAGDSGTILCVPMTVVNFDTISAFSFGVKWDATVLSYNTSQTPGNLQGFTNGNITVVGSDSIYVSWQDVDNTGETLNSGAELLELCFRLVGAPARSSFLNIGNVSASKPGSGSITDLNANNGLVIINSPPVAPDFRVSAADQDVNPGGAFCVPVRVGGFEDIDAFSLDISWDNTVLEYTTTADFANLNGLDMGAISTNGSPPSGITVDWSDPDNMGRELFFNTQLFRVCFTAIGSAGTSSPFDLSNATASNADGLPVEEVLNDAEINLINPAAPDLILQLDTIELSNGDEGCLTMSVEDFTDIETLEFDLSWNSQNLIFQSANILANVPGLDASNITTPSSGGNDGEVLFRWQDDNNVGRVLTDGTALMDICFQADGANFSRNFEIENILVENTNPNLDKNGQGRQGRIDVLPDGSGGDLSLSAGDLNLAPGSSGCLPVRVSNFVDVVSLQIEMNWDSNIFSFDQVQNLISLSGFSMSSISSPTPGSLIMSWDDSDLSGETLMDNSILFEICGDAVNEGTTTIEFSDTEATDLDQNLLSVSTNNGQVTVSTGGGGSDLEVSATNETIDVGDQLCMPIRVRNFEDLIVAELGVSWDPDVVQFDQLQNIAGIANLQMSSFSTPPDNGTDNLVLMSWLHEDLTGQDLPNDAVLFELCFTATAPGTSPVNILNAEFADVNNMLVPATLNDGSINVTGTAPGLRIEAPEITASPGENICLPITANDFESLIVMEFSLTWDDSVLDFDELQIPGNLVHLNESSFSTPPQNMTSDRIIVSWLDNELVGQSLADGTELFSVCYNVVGDVGDQSIINLEDAEFADADNNTVDGFLDDGLVRVEDGSTLNFEISSTTGNTVDEGEIACVPVQVSGFQELTALSFDFSWDEDVFSFSSVDALTGLADFDLSDITTPGGGGNPGSIAVDWSDSDNSGESLSDNTVLFELCLEAIGSPGEQSALEFSNLNLTNASAGTINSNSTNGNLQINQTTIEGLQFYMTDQTVNLGDEFCVPIQVNDFQDILSMEFNFAYDPAFLRFERIGDLANLPSLSSGSFSNPSDGLIILSWIDDLDLSGESLPDGDTLFTACFTALNPGTTNFEFTSEEVADVQNNLLTPTLTDAEITIEGNQPSGDLLFLINDVSGDSGQSLCVQVSTENFNDIGSANFTVRWDEAVLDFQNVNINGSLSNFDENSILDPIESPALGPSLIVDWDNAAGGASLPTPSNIFELCFELVGDPGTQSVLAIENLTAENGAGDLVAANRNNGSITINAGQTSDVRVNAGVGSGDRNEELCIDVTVENFTDILSAEFIMEWDPNILQFSQVTNLANLPDLSPASFGVPSQTNIPGLLSFTWFDNNLGNHSLADNEVLFSVCFDLIGAPGSSSALRLSDLEFSTGPGTGIPSTKTDGRIDINNLEASPTVGFNIADGTVNSGQEICLPVEVDNFMEISLLELDFEWDDNILNFERVEIVAPVPDLDPSDFTNMTGLLALQWSDGSGQGATLIDGQVIFRLCFTATGMAGSSSQVFISDGNIENNAGKGLNFAADNGLVQLNDILTIGQVVIDSVDCAGGANASIDLNVTGGDGNYSYTWNPNIGSGPTVTGLSAGTYEVTVSDGTGASLTRTFTLNDPPPLMIDLNITGVNPPMNNGAIDLNVSGGTPPYSIDWCCNLPDDVEQQTELEIGIYSATITDSKGCVLQTGDIDLDGAIFTQIVNVDSTSCHNSNDGSIEIDISGGEEPYNITWTDGTELVGVGETLNDLAPGEYFYTITDASSPQRMLEGSVVVESPPEIVVAVDVSPETNAGNDGSIETTVSGGTPGFTYEWFDHQTNATATTPDLFNLSTGYYSLTVQDANDCVVRVDSIFVGSALNVPEAGIIVDSISCHGVCDGKVTLFPEGGTGEYVYSYDGSGNVPDNSKDGLCAGERIIIVEDVNSGDRIVVRVVLEDPDPIEVQTIIVGVSSGNDGEILLEVDGGTAPYSYQWSTNDTTRDITGLSEDTYDVTVTDANGCEVAIEDIEVKAQTLSLDLLGITDVDCASDENGSIEINVSGGCEPYRYTWRQNGTVISNERNLTNASAGFYELQVIDSCNESIFSGFIEIQAISNMVVEGRILSDYNGFDVSGAGQMDGSARVTVTGGIGVYNYEWSNGSTNNFATGLSAGTAFVTITDELGCVVFDTLELSSPDPIDISFDILQQNDCFDDLNGIATAIVSGGVLPYTYSWDNTGSSSATSQGLMSGFNTVTVEDANGIKAVDSIFISSNSPIEIDTIIRPDFGNGEGGITLIVSGGMAPYTFQWNDDDNSTTSSISGLIAGEYGVVITDAEGCSVFLNLRVPLNGSLPECLESREVFTPNGDGKNEFFVINCIENYENDIQIFNRWGEVVFEQTGYDNFWNGRNQDGELLPQGAYFFVLTIINDMGQREVIKGHISLIR